jgi:hypothetical protein
VTKTTIAGKNALDYFCPSLRTFLFRSASFALKILVFTSSRRHVVTFVTAFKSDHFSSGITLRCAKHEPALK